ncbi:unnamed protein product [Owenia fusiformis]|uniref:N-acetyltransferase domain-containing protein n=1 Tax=Owenia fusiformis TaxID=6347 RepID=A0A8S4MYH1_OWEFU|nr:unnamed protein product [Owenia fusiformis]
MLGLFNMSNKPPIRVKRDELEIRLFDPNIDNWEEVKKMALTSYTEPVPIMMKGKLFHPKVSSVLALLAAGTLYQMRHSLMNGLIFLLGLYSILYFLLVWGVLLWELSKLSDYHNFVEYWTEHDHKLWLLFHRGKLIGSIGVNELDVGKRGELTRVVVATDYRGNGLADLMVNFVIDYCKKYNYDELMLRTSVHQQSAMRVYEKCGFTRVRMFTHWFIEPILGVQSNIYNIKLQKKQT